MNRVLLLILLFTVIAASMSAQEEVPSRKGKVFLIPEIWLSFGTRTYIDVAPMVGYHINNRLSAGLGPHFIYESQRAYSTWAYGLKGFARFSVITNAEEFLPIKLFSDLFVHVEYEGLSLEKSLYIPPYTDDGRFIYQGFLVGGGFSQRVGMYNSASFMVLWDLNESSYSPYSNPIFRVGFNAYF